MMAYSYADIPARIAGTGSYLPERVVANHELPGLEETNGAVERLLGAVERRAADESETCSDLIVKAARRVLESADTSVDDIDRMIVSATPGDYFEPCTASVVQDKLGARCPSMDVGMSCVGWLAAVDLGLRCIATGDKRVLALGGTIVSKGTAFFNPMHRAIFGDGAGGVLLERCDEPHFHSGRLWTDGQYHTMIVMPHTASVTAGGVPDEFEGSFFMGDRRDIYKALDENLPEGVEDVLQEAGMSMDDIDVAFVHQPSKPLFERAVKASGVPREKIVEDYASYGNTISAELPILLDENVRKGRVKRGDTILKITFGAGFSGGLMVYRY
jgi:3-oxoacyl-[acyl-carrier-protein] synthase III